MKTRLARFLALLALAGIAALAGSVPSAEAGDDPAAATAAPEAPQTLAERIRGEWRVILSEQEKQQLETLKFAFRDPPPTDAEIEAANLSQEEGFLVALILMSRAQDPNDPKIASMRATMESLANVELSITADKMTMAIAGDAEEASYRVVEEGDSKLEIKTTNAKGEEDDITLTFDGDTLTLTEAAETEGEPPTVMNFKRK